MEITQKQTKIAVSAALVALIVFFVYKSRKPKKLKTVTIKDTYTVPQGTPNMADALHAFERRKSDGFGGRMSTKINEALRKMYAEGINPDILELKVTVDGKKYKVDWEATLGESKDGKAYVGISTVGSAGAGADSRALSQIANMKTWAKGAKDYTLVLDFVNPKDVYIRQYFYKYTKPTEYPPL
jgi:hypothetical protein